MKNGKGSGSSMPKGVGMGKMGKMPMKKMMMSKGQMNTMMGTKKTSYSKKK